MSYSFFCVASCRLRSIRWAGVLTVDTYKQKTRWKNTSKRNATRSHRYALVAAAAHSAASVHCLVRKAIHLQHPDLEVAAVAQGRIVERLATVRLPVTDVFVHPYRLTLPLSMQINSLDRMSRYDDLPSSNGDHLGIGSHEQLGAVPDFVALYPDPGVLGAFRVQREQERLAGPEIRLSLSPVVLRVALAPS